MGPRVAFHTFPQLHLLTPVFARDAAGERQSVRLGHHLIPPDGVVMATAPQRAGSLVVPSLGAHGIRPAARRPRRPTDRGGVLSVA